MIVDCIADLHGYTPELPGGDLLILAGDYTAGGHLKQWKDFFFWLKKQPYEKKIVIAGNHDNIFDTYFNNRQKYLKHFLEIMDFLDIPKDFEYLCDSGTEYKSLKIWGSPWTALFPNVNRNCCFFMDHEIYLDEKFKLIPENLDILITHGPMRHVLDTNKNGRACGSSTLRDHIDRAEPRFHIFGHIHEEGSSMVKYKYGKKETLSINCSYVNERYKPVFNHIRIDV